MDEATGTARVRSAHNGIMRWRKRTLPDGQEVTESNARFVRWSDGSLQVKGSQEGSLFPTSFKLPSRLLCEHMG